MSYKNFCNRDAPLYAHAPDGWGKLTTDLKKQLALEPDKVLMQVTKVDEVNGVTRVFGTVAAKIQGRDCSLPFVMGGHAVGPIPGMINGTGNLENGHYCPGTKILGSSQRHKEAWKCIVYDLSQNFHHRDGIIIHAIARADGTTSGCLAYPRLCQQEGEKFMSACIGRNLEALPSTGVGGLEYNKRMHEARQLVVSHTDKQENKLGRVMDNHNTPGGHLLAQNGHANPIAQR